MGKEILRGWVGESMGGGWRGQTASIIRSIFQNQIVVAIVPRVKFVYMGHEYMTVGSVFPKTCDR